MRPARFHRLREVLCRRQPDLTVLMETVHKPHNFSAILRNCDAVGVLDAHVVAPDAMELHHGTSGGTTKWVRVRRHPHVEAAVEHLHQHGFEVLAAHPGAGARHYAEPDLTRPVALMVGAELTGVSDQGLQLADGLLSIPMMGMVHSLNVSVATSILLYEALRQRQAAGMYEASRLSTEEFERILFEWAHPLIANQLRSEGRPYPGLDEDGQPLPSSSGRPN